MATMLRPELSKSNKYYIDRHRHYELKHFCLQYPEWKKEYMSYANVGPGLSKFEDLYFSNKKSDPTLESVLKREYYRERMEIVEDAAVEADEYLYEYILRGVTEGLSYTYLRTILQIPCSKDIYYDRYRRFFWILNKKRG